MVFSLTSHASSQIRSQLTVNAHLCLLEPSQVYTNSALIHSLCLSLSTLLTPPTLISRHYTRLHKLFSLGGQYIY